MRGMLGCAPILPHALTHPLGGANPTYTIAGLIRAGACPFCRQIC
jgi:hypothetical protein